MLEENFHSYIPRDALKYKELDILELSIGCSMLHDISKYFNYFETFQNMGFLVQAVIVPLLYRPVQCAILLLYTTKGGLRRLEKSQTLDNDDDCCQFDVGRSS